MQGPSYIEKLREAIKTADGERGTAIVEYAGMLAGIAIVVIASLVFLGGAVGGSWTNVVINAPLAEADYGISPHECKKGGWEGMTDGNGNPFTNQGDCIQYAQNGN